MTNLSQQLKQFYDGLSQEDTQHIKKSDFKKNIVRKTYNPSTYDLEGSLLNLRNKVDELIDDYGETATIDISSTSYYGDSEVEIEIYYSREETDTELISRLKQLIRNRKASKKRLESSIKKKKNKEVNAEVNEKKQLQDLIKKHGIPEEFK